MGSCKNSEREFMTAIKGDYRTHKHIPSRSCYQLIIEVSEEEFPKVCDTLGYPKTGENTYVGIALLDKQLYNKPPVVGKSDIPQPVGDVLRNRAVMLCKDLNFQKWTASNNLYINIANPNEIHARNYILHFCGIDSRAELATNKNAQDNFLEIFQQFDAWKVSNQYADILGR